MNSKTEKKRGTALKNSCFSIIAVLLVLSIMEFFFRVCLKPSDTCYGTLFNISLPPFRIAPSDNFTPAEPEARRKELQKHLLKYSAAEPAGEGEASTDDLFGVFLEDEFTGYEYLESCSTPRKWWHINNLGARAWNDTTKKISPGKKRILAFGDSFTACSHIQQSETWPVIMEEKNSSLEVLNFGVDGYSMGQSLLRYRKKRDLIDYDQVILVFVPFCDLTRDINTYRRLMGWESWMILPRFTVERDRLELVRGPYRTSRSFCQDNRGKLSARAVDHLRKYDALYYPTKYENGRSGGDLILMKLFLCMYNNGRDSSLHNHLYDPDREALSVSRKIFVSMQKEVESRGGKFRLFVLPCQDELHSYGKSTSFKKKWDRMVNSIVTEGVCCTDLTGDLVNMDENQFDRAGDRFHNGKKSNTIIADLIIKSISGDIVTNSNHLVEDERRDLSNCRDVQSSIEN